MTKRPFIASEKQQAFFEFVANPTRGNCVLIAVAGSGKSTSIARSLTYCPKYADVQVLMFGNRTAKDMKEKVAEVAKDTGIPLRNVRVATFHSYGYATLAYWLKQRGVAVGQANKNKCRDLLKKMLSDDDFFLYGSFVCELVSKAKGAGVGIPGMMPANEDSYYEMIEHYGMTLENEKATEEKAIGYARELLKASYFECKNNGSIDFDDMLFMPLALNCRFYKQDIIYGDEMQDSNVVRREIIKRGLKPNGRMFAVGDPKQSIFGFTGASNDAMSLIKEEHNCVELMLNVSYRCPKAIVGHVKTIVSYFEVHENNKEGDQFDVSFKEMLDIVSDKDAILCRNVAPMVSLAFKIIATGRACHVLGSEIGKGLISLVKRMEASTLPELEGRLAAWLEVEVARFMERDKPERAAQVTDKVQCITVMIEALPVTMATVQGLMDRIDSLFRDEEATLCLSSMHKSKGREWENVVLYRPELLPSPWARKAWMREQEENLEYVAWTRTMNYLLFLPEVK